MLVAAMTLVVALGSAGGPASHVPAGPYVLVLGTAQDGGVPQVGCSDPRCVRARRHVKERRLVASLLVCDPATGGRWLIDATPDLREQVERAEGHPATRRLPGPRPPLFDGIFLTHAHAGHYTGLAQLGREAYGAHETPVFGTDRMREFLTSNGPWSLLVSGGYVALRELVPDEAVTLAPGLAITPIVVPHRAEFTDTVGFVVAGPGRKLLYIPDIDKWDRWDRRIEDVLSGVDVALLDGTFFEDGEIPGRSMADIPHPFIVESLARLSALPASERAKVVFTHLNHTNPACDARGPAARRIRDAGMAVATEAMVVPL